MDMLTLPEQLQQMRRFYATGATRSYAFRKQQLLTLKKAVEANEEAIYAALQADLHKSKEECWVTENGFFLTELKDVLANLKKWMEPEPVPTNLLNLPSSSKVMREPLGVVLIIGPWNYPFQLLFTPLIGALAAGNCVVLKLSEFAPATASIMQQIIASCFPPEPVLYVPGDGSTVIPEMMFQLMESQASQISGLAFDAAAKEQSTGFELVLRKSPQSRAWYGVSSGMTQYTVTGLQLELLPVTVQALQIQAIQP